MSKHSVCQDGARQENFQYQGQSHEGPAQEITTCRGSLFPVKSVPPCYSIRLNLASKKDSSTINTPGANYHCWLRIPIGD
jgi:hypothetical protein